MSSPLLKLPESVGTADQTDLSLQDPEADSLHLVDNVEHLVRDLLSQWQHPPDALERRNSPRVSFQKMIALFEFDESLECLTGEPWMAVGKDISLKGVSLSHHSPLPFTKVAIGFELPCGLSQFVLTRLSWCRFTRRGTYESGGTFLRPIETPQDISLNWSEMQRI